MKTTKNIQVNKRQFLSICHLLSLCILPHLITLRLTTLVILLIFSKNGDYETYSENRNIQPLFYMGYICKDF